MKYLIAFVPFIFYQSTVFAQKRIWDQPLIKRFTSSKKDSLRSPSILFLPVLSYSPETKLEYGLTGIYNFYTNKADTSIYTSTIYAVTSLTTAHQVNIKLKTDIWTTNNDYHYIGAIRYKKYPFNYYGLGDQTRAIDKIILTQKFIQLNFEVEKKITKNYYGGVNALFENYTYKDDPQTEADIPPTVYGSRGGKYIALGISQSYDTRNSNTETTKGFYGRLKYAYAPDFWGGDNFQGNIFSLNLRAFFPIHKNLTLGVQSLFETISAKNVPFYLTRQLGNDEIMRGYYQGRYRDNNYLTGQSELRYRFHPRIGVAAFLGAGTVYKSKINLSNLKFSGGGGIRYFFDLEHNSSIRIDYAIAEKNPGEKRQSAFYLALGQAF